MSFANAGAGLRRATWRVFAKGKPDRRSGVSAAGAGAWQTAPGIAKPLLLVCPTPLLFLSYF